MVLLGNSTKAASKYRIGSGVMKDTLDVAGARAAFEAVGIKIGSTISEEDKERIATVFINAGADATGYIRGRRTTMKSDFLAGYAGILPRLLSTPSLVH